MPYDEEIQAQDLIQVPDEEVQTFEEFIASEIEKGNITEEYTSLHDYYIGIGKTENEYKGLIGRLRTFKKPTVTLEVIRKESKIICPDGSEQVGSNINYDIPYKSGRYTFNIKTSKKTCTININIGDYVGIFKDSTPSAQDELQVLRSGNTLVAINTNAYIIDLKNKAILDVESATANIKYNNEEGILCNESINVPNDYIIDVDGNMCVDNSGVEDYIHSIYLGYISPYELKLVSGENEVILRKYFQQALSLLG